MSILINVSYQIGDNFLRETKRQQTIQTRLVPQNTLQKSSFFLFVMGWHTFLKGEIINVLGLQTYSLCFCHCIPKGGIDNLKQIGLAVL